MTSNDASLSDYAETAKYYLSDVLDTLPTDSAAHNSLTMAMEALEALLAKVAEQ